MIIALSLSGLCLCACFYFHTKAIAHLREETAALKQTQEEFFDGQLSTNHNVCLLDCEIASLKDFIGVRAPVIAAYEPGENMAEAYSLGLETDDFCEGEIL